jgi:hypothetical protein
MSQGGAAEQRKQLSAPETLERRRTEQLALNLLRAAEQSLQTGDTRAARQLRLQATSLWPQAPGSEELLRRIERQASSKPMSLPSGGKIRSAASALIIVTALIAGIYVRRVERALPPGSDSQYPRFLARTDAMPAAAAVAQYEHIAQTVSDVVSFAPDEREKRRLLAPLQSEFQKAAHSAMARVRTTRARAEAAQAPRWAHEDFSRALGLEHVGAIAYACKDFSAAARLWLQASSSFELARVRAAQTPSH